MGLFIVPQNCTAISYNCKLGSVSFIFYLENLIFFFFFFAIIFQLKEKDMPKKTVKFHNANLEGSRIQLGICRVMQTNE